MSREEIMDVILYYDKKGDNKIDVSQVCFYRLRDDNIVQINR